MLAFESIRCIMGKKLESWHLTPINQSIKNLVCKCIAHYIYEN